MMNLKKALIALCGLFYQGGYQMPNQLPVNIVQPPTNPPMKPTNTSGRDNEVVITVNNNSGNGNGYDEVDVVELFDETGDSMIFEIIGNAHLYGEHYMILTLYLEDEPTDDEPGQVLIMKEVMQEGKSMLEPVVDEALVARIYTAFQRESGDMYEYR